MELSLSIVLTKSIMINFGPICFLAKNKHFNYSKRRVNRLSRCFIIYQTSFIAIYNGFNSILFMLFALLFSYKSCGLLIYYYQCVKIQFVIINFYSLFVFHLVFLLKLLFVFYTLAEVVAWWMSCK